MIAVILVSLLVLGSVCPLSPMLVQKTDTPVIEEMSSDTLVVLSMVLVSAHPVSPMPVQKMDMPVIEALSTSSVADALKYFAGVSQTVQDVLLAELSAVYTQTPVSGSKLQEVYNELSTAWNEYLAQFVIKGEDATIETT